MTEDDTFNKLKRIPYSEMEKICITNLFDQLQTGFAFTSSIDFESCGWTREEFHKERYKRLIIVLDSCKSN